MGTPAQQYVNFDAGGGSVEPPKVDAPKVEEQPGAVETPAPADNTTPEVRSPRVVVPGVLSDSPIAGKNEQSIITREGIPQGYLGDVKHNLEMREYVLHRNPTTGQQFVSYAPKAGSNYPGAPIDTKTFTESHPFSTVTLAGDIDPLMRRNVRIDTYGRAIDAQYADPETTIDARKYLDILIQQQRDIQAWQAAGSDEAKRPQFYNFDALNHWDPETRRAAFAYFNTGVMQAAKQYDWYKDNISPDPEIRSRSRAQYYAALDQLPENQRNWVHPSTYKSGKFPHIMQNTVGLDHNVYANLWWTAHRMREFDAALARANAAYNLTKPADGVTRQQQARQWFRDTAYSNLNKGSVFGGSSLRARLNEHLADDSRFWDTFRLPSMGGYLGRKLDFGDVDSYLLRDMFDIAKNGSSSYETPDEFAYQHILRGGKSFLVNPESNDFQDDYNSAYNRGVKWADDNSWLGLTNQKVKDYLASPTNPKYNSPDPWVVADAMAYDQGVHGGLRQSYDANTRWLGSALHLNQALLRGSMNALTFGLANDAVDDYFRSVTGRSVEQNASETLSAMAAAGHSPYWVLAPGVMLETLPTLATAFVGNVSAPATTLNTAVNAGRTAQFLNTSMQALNTAYGAAKGTRAFNTGMNSFYRNLGYTMPVGSPEQKALIATANYGDVGNAVLPFTAFVPGHQFFQSASQAGAMNLPQYIGRLYEANNTNDPKYQRQLHIDNMADATNFLGDMFVSSVTGGAGNLSRTRKILQGIGGATLTTTVPIIANPTAKNIYDRSFNPSETLRDRLLPHEVQWWLAKTTGNQGWQAALAQRQDADYASQVASETEGYYDPQHPNYWLNGIHTTALSQTDANGQPLVNPDELQGLLNGTLTDTARIPIVQKQLAVALHLQASTGVVPPGFFKTREFQAISPENKQIILGKYIKAQGLLYADSGNKDALTEAGNTNDIGFLFRGDIAKDPRFNEARLAVTQVVNGMSLKDILALASKAGDSISSPEVQQLVMNSPAIKNIDIRKITPDTLEAIDAAMGNPAVKGAVMQMVGNLDLTQCMQQGADGNTSLNIPMLNWVANRASTDTEFGQVIQNKLNSMPIDQYIQMIGVAKSAMDQHSAGDGSGSDNTDAPKLDSKLFNMFDTSLRTRLEAGNADSDKLAYALIPYMRQGMSQSSNGPHVEPATAKAFMTVLKRREFWQQFDKRNMLSFCEYLVSGNGSKAFGALPEDERTQWVADIKATCEPIVQQHMWTAFKEGDIETVRRFIALKHNFAKDPLMFYGASAAIILGGITVLGGLFSSGDDEAEDDEEAEDDDAAYRKRIRKSLKQKEELNLDLNEDERD